MDGVAIVVFSDLVDSTALLARLGDDRMERVRRAHVEDVAREVKGGGGRVVKTLGDGTMATFESALGALRAAAGIQAAVERLDGAQGKIGIAARVGVAAGEPIADGDDLHGMTVVIASRLCSAAGSGEVLVQGVVESLVASRDGVTLEAASEYELKGVPDPVQASRLIWKKLAGKTEAASVGLNMTQTPALGKGTSMGDEVLCIGLLGAFSISVGDSVIADDAWRLRKAKTLIKLLALAPEHRLHVDQAIELLWAGRDPDSARNNLHQAIFAARRALDSIGLDGSRYLELREELILLSPEDPVRIDAVAFEELAAMAREQGEPGAYRSALEGFDAELLPADRYEDWSRDRRDSLEELRLALEAELAEVEERDEPEAAAGRGPKLPSQLTSFVGRERELAEVAALLRDARLLTLTGAGGCGKTRLALQVAGQQAEDFSDGVWPVELAALGEPELVGPAVAQALDTRLASDRAPEVALAAHIGDRQQLLLLDNCEHLVEPIAHLAEALLSRCPHLTVLATSREPLRVPGEVTWRVPSLSLPRLVAGAPAAESLAAESVRLFAARAAQAAPGFELGADNADAVASLCHRLDGMPLAIELAAARAAVLTPAQIVERLDDSLDLLSAGARTAMTRQQTLRATLAWSFDLLDAAEQVLLRRLAVFAGAFGLEAAEDVCAEDPLRRSEVVALLGRLIDKSLVQVEEGSGDRRYRLLETVRQYAVERLEEAGERSAFERRHRDWYLALAESDPTPAGELPARITLRGLDRERDNLRAALVSALVADPQAALRLARRPLAFLADAWLPRRGVSLADRRPGRGARADGGARPRPACGLRDRAAPRRPRGDPRARGRERGDLRRSRGPLRDVRRGRGLGGLPADRQSRAGRRAARARTRGAGRRGSASRAAADVGGAHARHRRLVPARIRRRTRTTGSRAGARRRSQRRAAPGALAAQLRDDLGRARGRLPAPRCMRTPSSSRAAWAAPRPPPTSSSTSPRWIAPRPTSPTLRS